MKQITLDKIFLKPRSFMSALLVLSLSLFSIFATAAQPDVDASSGKTQTERSTRDFNHMVTGFPLTGLHATVECASCHVGGVFKGTPRNCAGCHTEGMRVVATLKSLKHLVTTEPCEVCHTNTVSFYGARFNHGKVVAGQCSSCHNGIIATGRAPSHTSGKKLTDTCDHCHRTYAWIPATWNHTVGGFCSSCHNGVDATGKSAGHIATTDECNNCHTTQLTWLGALGAKPSNHILYTPTTTACSSCHIGGTVVTGNTLHRYVSTSCRTCHNSTATYLGKMSKKTLGNHEGSTAAQDCTSCHRTQYTNWNI
ncbi:MAG: hypothetical protein FD173_1351 [Gallionellaceae bacterium]|nr:MAG: hypothetical protein FD173_1351 [Gallionellaceae bacterium]